MKILSYSSIGEKRKGVVLHYSLAKNNSLCSKVDKIHPWRVKPENGVLVEYIKVLSFA